ncbi:hypothetical protein J7E93_28670 [Streptomyces sp. ISL-36]|uniref:hypothetical protein n=1 Tax=Streptomyces sp. ISL-36 TaxID=2819182 RepID=UPI001BEA64E5|nr:hypothetical protein [Streptomyces sp. ISL-36]MBT2443995.1 hypothetical protein [Streptomyces sp. ISL-36]
MPASRVLLWGGLAAAAAGAVLCVLGWYGISGERFAERQLPYLASCTVPGAALIVAGAVLVAAAGRVPVGRAGPGPVVEEETAADVPSSDEPPVRVPGGTLAHRPDCPLVADRADAVAVGGEELDPCPVCEPWPR